MAEDYYSVLGVARDAKPDQIQKAYRDLARKFHPDLHPDDKEAKKKFQQVQKAFEVLNDPQKREQYNQYGEAYESFAAGGAQDPRGRRSWNTGGGSQGFEEADFSELFGGGGMGGASFADLFEKIRGGGGAGARTGRRAARGADLAVDLEIPFTTAITGGDVKLTVSGEGGASKTLDVKIPPGVEEGEKLRLRGQGEAGARAGSAGDLLLTLRVSPHPSFQRHDSDLHVKTPVTLAEATLGAKVDLPTPRGVISLRIPPGTSSGTKLRVKGYGVERKGATAGNLYAEVEIIVPKTIDDESRELIGKLDAHWNSQGADNPRRDLKW